MNLLDTSTQADFGELVGISQQAVSEHLSAGVLTPGDAAGMWLMDYCSHLREQAAGRGADGELAHQRSELAKVSRQRAEIRLALERKESAAVNLLEQVIAHVGSQIRDHLQALPPTLKMRCPNLTADDLKVIETVTFETLNLAAHMSLASLTAMDDEESDPV